MLDADISTREALANLTGIETDDHALDRRRFLVAPPKPNLEITSKVPMTVEPGDEVEIEIDANEFGRIAAQTAKQVIVQKVREAEREQVVEEYQDREGELLSGLVKRVDRNGVFIDLGGNAEGFVPRDQMVPREPVRPQDRIKALLTEVRSELRGPQLFMTRTSPQFLIELFKIEVPEVGQGLIDILGAARDPGLRAKIAVKSNDNRIDAVGACVGMRGSRVQAVVNELQGEKIDIIPWHVDSARYVCNALAPAEISRVIIDEDNQSMEVIVPDDYLSIAIGKRGQNVRLALDGLLTVALDAWDEAFYETVEDAFEWVLSLLLQSNFLLGYFVWRQAGWRLVVEEKTE